MHTQEALAIGRMEDNHIPGVLVVVADRQLVVKRGLVMMRLQQRQRQQDPRRLSLKQGRPLLGSGFWIVERRLFSRWVMMPLRDPGELLHG